MAHHREAVQRRRNRCCNQGDFFFTLSAPGRASTFRGLDSHFLLVPRLCLGTHSPEALLRHAQLEAELPESSVPGRAGRAWDGVTVPLFLVEPLRGSCLISRFSRGALRDPGLCCWTASRSDCATASVKPSEMCIRMSLRPQAV